MNVHSEGFRGNCGMAVLYHFDSQDVLSKRKPKDRDIVHLLKQHVGHTTAIVAFSGADYQKEFHFSPQFLASWLKKKGEKVVSVARVNGGSGSTITAYYWAISDKMAKKLGLMQKKDYNHDIDG